jgi:hypothetical protein
MEEGEVWDLGWEGRKAHPSVAPTLISVEPARLGEKAWRRRRGLAEQTLQ